jgi:hypothetical protein
MRPCVCNNIRVGCAEGNGGTVAERLPQRSRLVRLDFPGECRLIDEHAAKQEIRVRGGEAKMVERGSVGAFCFSKGELDFWSSGNALFVKMGFKVWVRTRERMQQR